MVILVTVHLTDESSGWQLPGRRIQPERIDTAVGAEVAGGPLTYTGRLEPQVGQELLDAVRQEVPGLPPAVTKEDRALLAELGMARGSGRPGGAAGRARTGGGLSISASAPPSSRKVLGGDDLDDDFALGVRHPPQTPRHTPLWLLPKTGWGLVIADS